jgi:DNA-binding LacI/PurR family transcriptional regulator
MNDVVMTRYVRLRDVAEYAGVSVTTVSNVVRDFPFISAETRDKVQEAIDTLGYSPHVVARGLRSGQTQALAFIVPDLPNPYFAEIVAAAEDIAQHYGYTLLVFNSHEDEEREAACIRRATSRWADGLLIAHTTQTRQSPDLWRDLNIPVVAIDRIPDHYVGNACALDNLHAGQLATEHLIACGHRHIAHIAGPANVRPALDRHEGYRQALAAHGIGWQRVLHCSPVWGPDDGFRLANQLLDEAERPTALFASNDRVAIGALHALQERSLRVPQDVSLVGVDDIEFSQHLNPPLTTVRQPLEALAQEGVDMLLRLIRGETLAQPTRILQPELVVRRSTAPVEGMG